MTDNGSWYNAGDAAGICKAFDLKHIRTKPYTPKTNEKAERFIQTALRKWAFAKPTRGEMATSNAPERLTPAYRMLNGKYLALIVS
jgi:transposase InsO family protein